MKPSNIFLGLFLVIGILLVMLGLQIISFSSAFILIAILTIVALILIAMALNKPKEAEPETPKPKPARPAPAPAAPELPKILQSKTVEPPPAPAAEKSAEAKPDQAGEAAAKAVAEKEAAERKASEEKSAKEAAKQEAAAKAMAEKEAAERKASEEKSAKEESKQEAAAKSTAEKEEAERQAAEEKAAQEAAEKEAAERRTAEEAAAKAAVEQKTAEQEAAAREAAEEAASEEKPAEPAEPLVAESPAETAQVVEPTQPAQPEPTVRVNVGASSPATEPRAKSTPGEQTPNPIHLELSERFAVIRQEWFATCLEKIELSNQIQTEAKHKIPLVNLELGGAAESSLKVFQMQIVSAYLQKYPLVPGPAGREFLEKLQNYVFSDSGPGDHEARELWEALAAKSGAKTNLKQQFGQHSRSLAVHITGRKDPGEATEVVSSTYAAYLDVNQLEIAKALGDKRTVTKLRNKLSAIRPDKRHRPTGKNR